MRTIKTPFLNVLFGFSCSFYYILMHVFVVILNCLFYFKGMILKCLFYFNPCMFVNDFQTLFYFNGCLK